MVFYTILTPWYLVSISQYQVKMMFYLFWRDISSLRGMLCSRNSKYIESVVKDIRISKNVVLNYRHRFCGTLRSEILVNIVILEGCSGSCLSASSKAATMIKSFSQCLINIFLMCYQCRLFPKQYIIPNFWQKQNFKHPQMCMQQLLKPRYQLFINPLKQMWKTNQTIALFLLLPDTQMVLGTWILNKDVCNYKWKNFRWPDVFLDTNTLLYLASGL